MADAAANPRAVPGGNHPPGEPPFSDAYSGLLDRRDELVRTASAWLNTVQTIDTPDQAERAGGFKKQLTALRSKAKRAATEDMRPHKAAAEVIGKRYDDIKEAASICLDMIDPLLTAWFERETARKQAALAAAQLAAVEARAEAEAATRRAMATTGAAQRGELAGTAVNTVGQIAEAERLRQAAEEAERQVAEIDTSKPMVGGSYLSGAAARSISMAIVGYEYAITDWDAALDAFIEDGAPGLQELLLGWVSDKHKEDRTWSQPWLTATPVERPK